MEIAYDSVRLESFGLDRPFEVSDGFVAAPVLLRDHAEQVVAHVPRGIALQAAPRVRGRLVGAAGIHHQLGENFIALCGIAPASQFSMLARQGWLSFERVNAGQGEMRLRLDWIDLDCFTERGDR